MPTPVHPKLQLFVISKEDGRALSAVPVLVIAEVPALDPTTDSAEVWRAVLQSDHVGYLSFTLDAVRLGNEDDGRELRFKITPYFDDEQTIELGRWALTWREPNPVPVRVDVPESPTTYRRTYSSIEFADVRDWRTSPLSFGTRVFASEETGPCAPFLPSGAAKFLSRFSEVAIDPSEKPSQLAEHADRGDCETYHEDVPPETKPARLCYKLGRLIEYETSWNPINHGLGEILHSLTLAPCEQVNFAVIDWKRSDDTQRTEDQTLTESLEHELRRDRFIEEVVDGAVRETQRGKSFLGGTAGTGGYGTQGNQGGGSGAGGGGTSDGGAGGAAGAIGGGNPFSFGAFGSHALGIGKSRSSGNRDIEIETTQSLTDNIVQSANAVRRLRGTVVIQGSQAESENIQTRTVRNHNHCHAMTVLFYEIVRHFHVVTRATRERRVILLKYAAIDGGYIEEFKPDMVARLRNRLEPALLDARLAAGFDAIDALVYGDGESTRGDGTVGRAGRTGERVVGLRFEFVAGEGTSSRGIMSGAYQLQGDTAQRASNRLEPTPGPWTHAAEITFDDSVTVESLARVGFVFLPGRDNEDRPPTYNLERFRVSYLPEGRTEQRDLLDSELDGLRGFPDLLQPREQRLFSVEVVSDAAATSAIDGAQRLIDHLNANLFHYNKALWLSEDPDERIRRLERFRFGEGRLTDYIERDPIGIYGDYLIFVFGPPQEISDSVRTVCSDDLSSELVCRTEFLPAPDPVETIVALPTRGAYAETKLSECNACEVIDPTRFWKWQESPCPDDAPSITPIEAGSRSEPTDVDFTAMPNPVVNIQNAPAAPAPTGLAGALQLLATPEIFRDMSGIEQLGPLLQKLADVAAGTSGEIMGTVRNAHERNQLARDARDRGEISEEQANEMIAENTEQPAPEPERPRPTPTPPPEVADPESDDEPEIPDRLEALEFELPTSWEVRSRDTGFNFSVNPGGGSVSGSTADVDVAVMGILTVRGIYRGEDGAQRRTARYRYLLQAQGSGDQLDGFIYLNGRNTRRVNLDLASSSLPDLLEGTTLRLSTRIDRLDYRGRVRLSIPEVGFVWPISARFQGEGEFLDTEYDFSIPGTLVRGRELQSEEPSRSSNSEVAEWLRAAVSDPEYHPLGGGG